MQELIKALNLREDFSVRLNPFVRAKYIELWTGAKMGTTDGNSDSWSMDERDPDLG